MKNKKIKSEMTESSILDEINSTDDAFLSASSPHSFEGIELEPFSLMRQAVAMELAGIQTSAFFEAVIQVWLCTLTHRTILTERLDRDGAIEHAFEWAEFNGISLQNWKPLFSVYQKIRREIEQSSLAREKGGDGDISKNVGGPLVS